MQKNLARILVSHPGHQLSASCKRMKVHVMANTMSGTLIGLRSGVYRLCTVDASVMEIGSRRRMTVKTCV